jgi:predicted nucleotidyltransferase
MRPRIAAFRRPLDPVFAAPSHIAILRALLDSAEGMSGRQVARLAEINHQACAVALGRLEELGVVTRQGSGQSQLFRLNREHRVVQGLLVPLLRGERAIFLQALQRIGSLLAGHRVRALVFGSAARGEERRDSDLDLLLILPSAREASAIHQTADDVRATLRREWGIRVNVLILPQRIVERRQDLGDPLITTALREGIEVNAVPTKEQRRATVRTATTG